MAASLMLPSSMSTEAAAIDCAWAARACGVSASSSSPTSATQAATSPDRSNTTATVGVRLRGSCSTPAVLSLQGAWGAAVLASGAWRVAPQGCSRTCCAQAAVYGASKSLAQCSTAVVTDCNPRQRGARVCQNRGPHMRRAHPKSSRCASSVRPAASCPTADTRRGSGAPPELHSRAKFSATLRATPPGDCATWPGTEPPRRTSASVVGAACEQGCAEWGAHLAQQSSAASRAGHKHIGCVVPSTPSALACRSNTVPPTSTAAPAAAEQGWQA